MTPQHDEARAELVKELRLASNDYSREDSGDTMVLLGRAADFIEALSTPVSTGWRLVPVEPTEEMVEAGAQTIPASGQNWETMHPEYKGSCRGVARRVLIAALNPPAPGDNK